MMSRTRREAHSADVCLHVYNVQCICVFVYVCRHTCQHKEDGEASLRRAASLSHSPLSLSLSRSLCLSPCVVRDVVFCVVVVVVVVVVAVEEEGAILILLATHHTQNKWLPSVCAQLVLLSMPHL